MTRIVWLACEYGRYGSLELRSYYTLEGWRVTHKRVERIWRDEGLKVSEMHPTRRPLWFNDGSCIRLRSVAKDVVRRVTRRMGFELQRVARPTKSARPYYRVSPTCQIPELATLFELFFGKRSDGYFVEVGAFDGDSFSNSSCLADRGWRGLLIEPVPAFAQQCRSRHAANRGVTVVEVAVGAEDCDVTLHVAQALTTSDPALLETYRGIEWAKEAIRDVSEIRVRQRRLDDLLVEQKVH